MADRERIWIDRPTHDAWTLGEDIPGVRFRMGQPVEVVDGPHRAARGVLICLYALAPEPEFHLETEDGGDLVVIQSHLSGRIEDDCGSSIP